MILGNKNWNSNKEFYEEVDREEIEKSVIEKYNIPQKLYIVKFLMEINDITYDDILKKMKIKISKGHLKNIINGCIRGSKEVNKDIARVIGIDEIAMFYSEDYVKIKINKFLKEF